jgi:uncharacterized phiE125 gp8 family phage protein
VFRRRFLQSVTQWSMSERHVLPIAPVASVEVLRVTDRAGVATVMDPASYALVTTCIARAWCPRRSSCRRSAPAGSPRSSFSPGIPRPWDGLPADIRQAVLMLAGTFFGQNESAAEGFPAGVLALIEPYRTLRLSGAGA